MEVLKDRQVRNMSRTGFNLRGLSSAWAGQCQEENGRRKNEKRGFFFCNEGIMCLGLVADHLF